MDALQVGIAGDGADRLARQLAEAARQHGVDIEPSRAGLGILKAGNRFAFTVDEFGDPTRAAEIRIV